MLLLPALPWRQLWDAHEHSGKHPARSQQPGAHTCCAAGMPQPFCRPPPCVLPHSTALQSTLDTSHTLLTTRPSNLTPCSQWSWLYSCTVLLQAAAAASQQHGTAAPTTAPRSGPTPCSDTTCWHTAGRGCCRAAAAAAAASSAFARCVPPPPTPPGSQCCPPLHHRRHWYYCCCCTCTCCCPAAPTLCQMRRAVPAGG
jgi:hypothetical protein